MKIIVLWIAALMLILRPPPPEEAFSRARKADGCSYNPLVATMLTNTTIERYQGWMERLTGAKPVWVEGKRTFIETRYSTAMFAGQQNARGFDYVLQVVRAWVDDSQIEIDTFAGYAGKDWKNLVVTFPGTVRPDEVVLLVGHLDSKSLKPFASAPGADDNASGSAALIEAVYLFRNMSFERTVKVIFFTGEEWGMWGSRAYVRDHTMDGVVGVINLDMYGYDGDGDRCFELHVGKLAASDRVGKCIVESIAAYGLDLRYDYVVEYARAFSDHSSFWDAGVGAVLVMENMFEQHLADGCAQPDSNPAYHSTADTMDGISLSYAFDISRAGLAAAAALALPQPVSRSQNK